MELVTLPVPQGLMVAVGAIGSVILAYWAVRRIAAFMHNRLSAVHTLYMLSHFTIFTVGYLLIEDITFGWLVINIWHNAQYILFVWLFNTRRFKHGLDEKALFLSYISQPHRLGLYLSACLGITGVIYFGVLGTLSAVLYAGLGGTIVLYQILNFHHYIVNSMIWKVRSKAIAQTLGLGH